MRKTLAIVAITCVVSSTPALTEDAVSTAVTVWYKHSGSWIPALPAPPALPRVAVYLFQDSRPSAPDAIPHILPALGIDPAHKGPPAIRTSETVVFSVTTALAEGLAARGFPVLDRTRRAFHTGDPPDGAKRGLRGDLLRFGVWPAWDLVKPFEGAYALTVGGIVCAVSLEVFDLQSGGKLWEKTYGGRSLFDVASSRRLRSDMEKGSDWARGLEPSLTAALAAMVENAVMDPELADALGRSAP
jgi:hypothetical protein